MLIGQPNTDSPLLRLFLGDSRLCQFIKLTIIATTIQLIHCLLLLKVDLLCAHVGLELTFSLLIQPPYAGATGVQLMPHLVTLPSVLQQKPIFPFLDH